MRAAGAAIWLQVVSNCVLLIQHVAQVDCLQRAARHRVSEVDLRMAYQAGRVAVEWALNGVQGMMTGIVRHPGTMPSWQIEPVSLVDIGDQERRLPPEFIDAEHLDVTPAFLDYLRPLLAGEAPPSYGSDGLPDCRSIAWPSV